MCIPVSTSVIPRVLISAFHMSVDITTVLVAGHVLRIKTQRRMTLQTLQDSSRQRCYPLHQGLGMLFALKIQTP